MRLEDGRADQSGDQIRKNPTSFFALSAMVDAIIGRENGLTDSPKQREEDLAQGQGQRPCEISVGGMAIRTTPPYILFQRMKKRSDCFNCLSLLDCFHLSIRNRSHSPHTLVVCAIAQDAPHRSVR